MKHLYLLLVLLLPLAGACSDEPPDPSANLRHPSGLVYLERVNTTDTSTSSRTTRADLYIADAEAEGVRVRQFFRGFDEDGDPYVVDTFIPSEAIYIPLVISAPGFPEEISPAVYTGPGTTRASLYALAPAGVVSELDPATGNSQERFGLLHVLDVRENPFGVRASEPGNTPIGLLPLDQILDEPAIPTDVEVLASLADRDLVLVAFDPISGGPGQVALLSVQVGSNSVTLLGSDTATVAQLPRALIHAGNGQVLVSSAGTSTVTELTLDLTTGAFLGSRALPAGGPTQGLIPIPGYGALALRVDRPSAMVFTSTSGRFERSTALYYSPFTPLGERPGLPLELRTGELPIGRIDLRGSPATTGAYGRVAALKTSVDSPSPFLPTDLSTDEDGVVRGGAVLLAHLDGRVSFLVGTPPRVFPSGSSAVTGLIDLGAVTTGSAALAAQLAECSGSPVDRLKNTGGFGCREDVLAVEPGRTRKLRVQFQGALRVGRAGLLTVTSTTLSAWTLRDEEVPDFLALQIKIGDLVDLEHHGTDCSTVGASAQDYLDRAVITTVTADRIELRATGDFRALLQPCGEVRARYEVFPAGDEGVLTEVEGATIRAVLARAEVQTVAERRQLPFAADLAVTLVGNLACDEADTGRMCSSDEDCAGGQCALSVDGVGPGLCTGPCDPGSPTCVNTPRVRRCAGVEVLSEPSVVALDLRNITSNSPNPKAAVPAAAVFARVRQSWFISYPGSRSLATVEPLVESIQTLGTTR